MNYNELISYYNKNKKTRKYTRGFIYEINNVQLTITKDEIMHLVHKRFKNIGLLEKDFEYAYQLKYVNKWRARKLGVYRYWKNEWSKITGNDWMRFLYGFYINEFKKHNKLKHKNTKNNIIIFGQHWRNLMQLCITSVQFINNNKIMVINQRSCDMSLGWISDLYHFILIAERIFNLKIEKYIINYCSFHNYRNNEKTFNQFINNQKHKPFIYN